MYNLKDFIGIKAAAVILGINDDTLRHWSDKGQIKTYRHPINGYKLYKRKDLEEFLKPLQDHRTEDKIEECTRLSRASNGIL